MNTLDKTKTIAPDARAFLGGNYLRKEDLAGPITVTVEDVRAELIPESPRKSSSSAFAKSPSR